jgi:hypothetical protein
MLRNNKVTIKGFETLEDYFKSCDKARKITKDMEERTRDFSQAMDGTGDSIEGLNENLANMADTDTNGIGDGLENIF